MRKIYLVLSFIVLLLVGFLSITYSYEYNENNFLQFELIGEYEMNLSLYDKYVEYGVIVTYNNEDISSLVKIDNSMVDTSLVGEYKVRYEVNIDNTVEYIYRVVKVTEKVKPVIKLRGDDIIYVDLNGKYVEPGFDVSDNYDSDLYKNMVITSNLNVRKKGEYEIIYKVTDSSGNETMIKRRVIVR